MGMPMLRFTFRKMWNTRWLTFSSLLGLLIAVAFTTSIPMYADGALKRVVSTSLKAENEGMPAGSLLIRYQAAGNDRPEISSLEAVDSFIKTDIPQRIGFPQEAFVQTLSLRGANLKVVDPQKTDASKRRQMTLSSMSGLADQVEFTRGQAASTEIKNGVIEVVALEDALYRNYIQIGDEFTYPISGGQGSLKVRIVGSFSPKDETKPYWYEGTEGLLNTLLVNETLFTEELLKKKNIPLTLANWYYAFDLKDIQTSQLAPLTQTLDRLDIELYQLLKDTKVDISFKSMLGEFRQQSLQLQFLLLTLAAPMIAMVFYYIATNSRQALDKQRTDIAVLRSRGASTSQIVRVYLLEGFILGGISLLIGPLIGWFMAKSIGSASGFLYFVDRKAVPVGFGTDAMLYGGAAVLVALTASLIPAISYARSSIVGLRAQMARADRKPVWQRWFLDLALLGLVGYGYYLFQERQMISLQTGLASDQLQVQPMLFFVPAMSIFAMGLFFLRIFPWLLKLFSWLGRKFLPVPLYLTLLQLSRSAKSYYPLMLLLILTLGLGVYNSAAARTIDQNSTERTLYEYGTDVIINSVWEGFTELDLSDPGQGQGNSGGSGGGQNGGQTPGGGQGAPGSGNPGAPGQGGAPPKQALLIEPPFQIYKELPGVEHAARVLKTKASASVSGKTAGQVTLMAIDNADFAKVGWFRNDLYPAHPYEYLNLLGAHFEQAVIIPQDFAEKHQLKPGDMVSASISGTALDFIVVGTVPYWPSLYPQSSPFFITNLEYIYDQVPLIPYEVWIKMAEGAKVGPLVEQLTAKGIQLASDVKDVRNELIIQGKHPARGGVFGILSLGFLVSVIISLVGYLLYWFFHLSGRVVQFGVLRAMGLSRKQLTGMLLLEQSFTAVLSIGLGLGIGKLTSLLFLPFLQTTGSAQAQVPPFRVIFEARDTLQIYAVVLFMMAAGATMLFLFIRRLRVHQAVKLGEER
ncbi:ABC transporter permease [Paenibacillus turpanensis]|uniref:ABC transporter permease n=1 Tax=Paenibacillus turpanensis TaxID=2689078 RepID=UPI001FB70080|nr:FtsX-like permease family protein [Paenibacillus turpanensis]